MPSAMPHRAARMVRMYSWLGCGVQNMRVMMIEACNKLAAVTTGTLPVCLAIQLVMGVVKAFVKPKAIITKPTFMMPTEQVMKA